MNTCQTLVEVGVRCGKPATEVVQFGLLTCRYCSEHAEAARRYIEKTGLQNIIETQRRVLHGAQK